MIIVLLFLSFFGLLVLWLLISPIRMTIHSKGNEYSFMWKGLVKIWVLNIPNELMVRVRFAFWQKDYDLLRMKAFEKEEESKKIGAPKKVRRTRNRAKRIFSRKWRKILKSFEIKTFKLNIDTSSFIRNSFLFPIFYFLSNQKRQLEINYMGVTNVHVVIENKLYRILKALFI